jgi:hypothetical protein
VIEITIKDDQSIYTYEICTLLEGDVIEKIVSVAHGERNRYELRKESEGMKA